VAKEAVAQKSQAAYSLRSQNEKLQQENIRKYVLVIHILHLAFCNVLWFVNGDFTCMFMTLSRYVLVPVLDFTVK